MIRHIQTDERDAPKRHHGIECLTCKCLVSKAEAARKHHGHTVVYLKEDGTHE